ncbi:MAG TPA: transglycosylase domain-containing protein [Actinomycetota bacterium]
MLASACVTVPSLDDALAKANTIAQTTKVYAADGSLITELHAEEDREVIPLAQVPEHVRDAVLAIEDARFYQHAGVDYLAVIRALTKNAAEGRVVEGGSTITQQLVKNTLVDRDRTVERKIKEAILAYQLEERFTKDEILERYLNTVYFGRGAYGIEAAAKTFFSKPAHKLGVVEGALLAGLIRSPSAYDPSGDNAVALSRRNVVLRRMFDEGMLPETEFDKAREAALGLKPGADTQTYRFAYFIDYIKDLIFNDAEEFGFLGETRAERINAVFKGGLRIHTSLNPELQRTAEKITAQVLPFKSDPHTAFVAIDPRTGGVVTMVGGRGFFGRKDRYAKYNLAARRPGRQPGSAFKLFTLIAALERGIPLERVYRGGSRISLRLPNGTSWSPGNYEGTNPGSSLTLKRGTALSVNVVYAQVVLEVGPKKVVEVAKRMGITAPLDAVHAIALGSEEVTPLDLATGYATLAAGGIKVEPTPIFQITDSSGTVIYEPKRERKRVLAEPVAALAIEALEEVMKTGTGRNLGFGRPVAGKTGTSENYADAWFAGFTPQMAAVSWAGFPQAQVPMVPPRTRRRVYGSSWPGEMWRAFMIAAHKGVATELFPEATDTLLVKVKVDGSRNCLPNEFTPPYLIEVQQFLRGSEPTEVCTEPTSGEIPSTPAVVGMKSSTARDIMEKAGFALNVVSQYCPAFAPGTVCDQKPQPQTAAKVGDPATIYVSNDAAISDVPMVLGRTVARARQRLIDAGFVPRVVTRANTGGIAGCRQISETTPGRVWLQSPCAGERYGRGATVTIYVNP